MAALGCDLARLAFTLRALIEDLPPGRGRARLTREQNEAVAA